MASAMVQEAMREYFAVKGSRFSNEDARVLGPWLQQVGNVPMEVLVEKAESPHSPAHPYFTWDDKSAAHRHRLAQASQMVAGIKYRVIACSGQEREIRSFQVVSVTKVDPKDTRKDKRGHSLRVVVSTDQVREEPDQAAEIKARCLNDLKAFRRKWEVYRDVLDVPTMGSLLDLMQQTESEIEANLSVKQ